MSEIISTGRVHFMDRVSNELSTAGGDQVQGQSGERGAP